MYHYSLEGVKLTTAYLNIVRTQQHKQSAETLTQTQDHQALLKAKYCPRVAAHRNTKKPMWPWPITLKFNTVLELVKVHMRAKLFRAKYSSSWGIMSTNFFALLQWWKIQKSSSVTLTLKFSGFLAVFKVHVHAKSHQAKCSGSWVIVRPEKKRLDENNTVHRYRGQYQIYF